MSPLYKRRFRHEVTILLLGIITWRIVVWRRRKVIPASQKYRQGSFLPREKIGPIVEGTPMEKQEVLVILPIGVPPTAYALETKWKPQIPASYNGGKVMDIKTAPTPEVIMSPPPTYTASNSPSATSSPSSTPSSSPRPPALNLPTVAITQDYNHLSIPAIPSPVPSPRRTSSFGLEEGANLRAKPSIKSVKGQKVPRKMLVEHTFVPSLADELSIKVGEVLNMLEEYEDEWCLVERIGSRSSERGVVPRFCLKERPRGHKRGQSSVSSSKTAVSTRTQ